MPSAYQACSCRFTLSRVTPTLRASCSCVMISRLAEILRERQQPAGEARIELQGHGLLELPERRAA